MADRANPRPRRYRAVQVAHVAIPLLALVALLALHASTLVSSGLNNLASLHLASEWQHVAGAGQVPRCLPYLSPPVASTYVSAALRLSPDDQRAQLNLGRTEWLAGHCGAAVKAWQQAMNHDGNDQTASVLLATSEYVAGDTSSFPRLLGTGLAAQYASSNAVRATLVSNEADTTVWRERAFAWQPTRFTADQLVASYSTQSRSDDVATVWQRLAAALPTSNADHWWALGQASALTQDWRAAASAYAQGAPIAIDPYPFWLQAGNVSLSARDGIVAERYFTQALASSPLVPAPAIGLGRAKYLQNDWAAALVWFQRAEELAPATIAPKYWLGLTYWQQKNFVQSQRYFQQLLQFDPKDTSSRYYVARSDYELGRLPEAINGLQQALELVRQSGAATKPWEWALLLGDWQLQSGDKPAALVSYRLALEWRPNDPTILKRIESAR